MKKVFDIKLIKFILVGICNTVLSFVIMLILYDVFNFNYWGSSAISYIIGSVLSFFLNKNFTFKNKQKITTTAVKFAIVVGICYLIAYGIAKPIIVAVFKDLTPSYTDKIAMLLGMVIFTALNYIGQRFIAFKNE